MISEGIEVNKFIQICLILEAKFGDNLLPGSKSANVNPQTI